MDNPQLKLDMQDDPLEETFDNFTQQMISVYDTFDTMSLFTDAIRLVLGLLFVGVDIFYMYIYIKNKNLRTKTNEYIFHYMICHILFLVSSVIVYDLFGISNLVQFIPSIMYKILFNLERISILLCYFFGFGLVIDWVIVVRNIPLGQNIRKAYDFSIYIFYGFTFLFYGVQFALSEIDIWYVYYLMNQIVYWLLTLLVVVCNIVKYRKRDFLQNKDCTSLTLANIMILFWLPLQICDKLLTLATDFSSYTLSVILIFTMFIPDWLVIITPIVIIVVLAKADRYFKLAISKKQENEIISSYKNQENSEDKSTPNTITSDNNVLIA